MQRLGINFRRPAATPAVKADDLISPIIQPVNFNAHAGEVMGSPMVIPVFWGNDYTVGSSPNLAQQIGNFLDVAAGTIYFQLLNDYGGTGMPRIAQAVYPAYTGGPTTLSDNDIENTIDGWIQQSLLTTPAEDETNVVIVVFVPQAVTLTAGGYNQNDPVHGFCGYHTSRKYAKLLGKDNLFFAAITWLGNIDVITNVLTHELVETFTDRSTNGYFCDDGRPTPTEIGDICNNCGTGVVDLLGYQVASYWRNALGACLQQSDVPSSTSHNVKVPNLRGDTLDDATKAIAATELTWYIADSHKGNVDTPTVTNVQPPAGTLVPTGTGLALTVVTPNIRP